MILLLANLKAAHEFINVENVIKNMSTPDDESNKETIYESNSDSEEPESSEEQEPRKSDEPTTTTPEERGVTVEGQQEQKADSTKEEEMRLEPQMEDSYRKLFYQFTKHFNPYWSITYNFPDSICAENLIDRQYLAKTLDYFRNSQD